MRWLSTSGIILLIQPKSSQADLERAKLRPGERLSIERATEIALDAMRKVKS